MGIDKGACPDRRSRSRGYAVHLHRRSPSNSGAASVVARFRAQNFEPAGYTLLSYAAVQVWAQAVEKAGSLELRGVIAALRSHEFDTVIGWIDFDDKGDLTDQSWVWYIFRGGEYVPLD